jgi:hypothetical protein
MQFDPTLSPPDKLRANPSETPEIDPAAVKARLAALVRADSSERRAPTQEHSVQELAPGLPAERWSELLAEMAAEPAYADIKAVVTPSGRVYLFSEPRLNRNDAAERCFVEEAKIAIAEKIRSDSQYVVLTPMADLERLLPWPEPERRAALVAELRADPRFEDIQAVTGPGGELHLHSDRYVSSSYGRIMTGARANDPARAISEFVRDRSRDIPAPTKITVFRDQVFAISSAQLASFVEGLDRPEGGGEHADIKKLVHPATGAVYLYSDRWLVEAAAVRIMDWEEVGSARNP